MESPTPETTPGPASAREIPTPSTPGSIYLALVLIVVAVAAPFIGEYEATHSDGDSWHTLRVLLKWLTIGAAAALGAIVSTVVGARRGPCTLLTKVTMALCLVMVFTVVAFLASH